MNLIVAIYNTPTTSLDALWHHGAFLHDQISVNRRLTLNLGLRWDRYQLYHPEQDVQAAPFRDFFYAGQPLPNGYSIPAPFPDLQAPRIEVLQYDAAFGPRLGAAYDLFGDGKNHQGKLGALLPQPRPDHGLQSRSQSELHVRLERSQRRPRLHAR